MANNNYQITASNEIGKGGAKTKAKANIAAVRLLKALEAEQRQATPDEQAVLVKFSGWGTVVDIFTDKPEWAKLQTELKDLLTDTEYESASAAILNAHYTAPEVATAIYEGLERLGFDGGKILDPSMGATGLFEGTLPDALKKKSEIVGIELDSLSGRIAQQLYPEASIHIRAFEDTFLPDDRFDLAVSNFPFSEIGVSDPDYDGLPIKTLHDYFAVKALDKVRPGGLTAFITSTGTMQSASSEGVRELLSERANLVGAMRLPSTAFKQVAGTEVTTDLIVLQKLGDGIVPNGIDWTELQPSSVTGIDGNALPVNEYYARNPQMMLGMLGDDKLHPGRLALRGDGRDIQSAMREAFSSFPEGIYRPASEATQPQQTGILIPPELQERIKPDAYVLYEDRLMQRAGHYLEPAELEGKKLERMKGMLAIRDAVQSVFAVQLQGSTEQGLQEAQIALNQTYNQFVETNGFIHQSANKQVFRKDPDYPLLLALENYDAETKTATKTAIFSSRVIQSHQEKTAADTPKEALLYSLNERGRVDLDYIARLVDQSEPEVTQALQQEKLIFLDPQKTQWVAEDEYLSGNVKEKLKIAQESAAEDPRYAVNVEALEAVQPPLIPPGDIEVRLGAAWVPPSDVQNFAKQLLEATDFLNIQYSPFLDIWSVDASYQVLGSVKNTKVHGTERVGALRLIELGLNLKDPVVYDKVDERLVVNQEDTAAARMKLEEIKVAFKDWVWQDPERTERLTNLYNEKFNTFRPRQYNGAHLDLPGSNPAIQLRPHQKNATWRVLQEGNSLLAHCVGAGKTFSVIAAAMEQKRLGLMNKPMVVVPNHLLEQWAGDFKRLYPNSNILAATKDDSSAKNRQELMSRIATGNWDAVIVTHSAFSKLKMSKDAQLDFYHAELAQVSEASSEAKGNGSSRSMIKEFERQKKRLQKRVDEISKSGKDDTVTFEQLGVDQVYIDEAHYFKNLGYSTKMYGIAGLPNTTSDRAFDLFMKCRYLGEQHGESKGVVFATGTPVSNSMAELYTMQRYLQPQALRQIGLSKFDAWASTFGETVTAPEITPAGGYKVKTRFSRFVNIPELMNTFRQVADIQTAEMLKLPVPELKGGKPEVVAVPATDMQLAFVEELAERAENLRDVDPRDDNMLLITTDGRKASLDMRLVNPYVSHERNKVDQLIEDTCQFWEETISQKTTHLIFCDMGTPKEDAGSKTAKQINVEKQFTVYGYIKDGLIARGIPASEIAFAQEFKTDAKKLEMQQKFNAGKIRVLISGSQLETGFNGQKKLGLESHLTVPWRPDQVEQRDGRILRQGNENPEVQVRRYVTQGRGGRPSFDSYMWQTLETKKKFIAQVMAGNSEVRTMADVAGAALTYAEVKAIATGNPLIMEKATVDNQISLLAAQKRSHLNQQYNTSRELTRLPERIDEIQETIAALKADAQKVLNLETLSVTVQGVAFTDLREAMKVVKARVLEKQTVKDFSDESIGQVGDFDLGLRRGWKDELNLVVRGQQDYQCQIEHTYVGTATNLTELLKSFETLVHKQERYLTENRKRLVELSAYSDVPFSKESELRAALKRQSEINTELGLSKDNAQAAAEAEEERAESEPAVTEGATVAPVPAVQEDRSPVDLSNLSVLPASQQQGRIEKRIATFLDKAGIREAVTAGEGFHLKIENEPYIPLVIERQQDELYLTHYLQQNGDTFIDSEMVFSIKDDGQLQLKETATQNPFQGGESRGCDRIFAQVFSRNVQTQGFGEAAREQLQQPQTVAVQAEANSEEPQAAETQAEEVQAVEPENMPTAEAPVVETVEPEDTPAAEAQAEEIAGPENTPAEEEVQSTKEIANPLYGRYSTQKEETPEAIVFVQTPISYQTFGQDAERYAEITGASLSKTDTQSGQLSTVHTSGASLERRIEQVTDQGIEIAIVEKDLTVQLHQPPTALANSAAEPIEPIEPAPAQPENLDAPSADNLPEAVEAEATGFLLDEDSALLRYEQGSLSLLPKEISELQAIFQSGNNDTEMRESIEQLFGGAVPPRHMESLVDAVMSDLQTIEAQLIEAPSEAVAEEIATPISTAKEVQADQPPTTLATFPIEDSLNSSPDEARETELNKGEAILKIAAQTYAFMETQGKVLPDEALEMWTAQGNHYDITYNPDNANFFVEGKGGSEMVVQSVDSRIDPDSTGAVSQADVERFEAIEKALAQHDFDHEQPPAQTQAIAQAKWESAVEAAASVLPLAEPASLAASEEQNLFPVEQYASESPDRPESIDSTGADPSWGQTQSESASTALLNSLQQWRQQAQDLARPQAYLDKIQTLVTAVESGNTQAVTDKATTVMARDLQAWQSQITTISEQAKTILDTIGDPRATGIRFDGKTYILNRSAEGCLSIQAKDRGEILRVDGDEIQRSTVTATDAARFQSFAQQVAQQAGQSARAPVAAGLDR